MEEKIDKKIETKIKKELLNIASYYICLFFIFSAIGWVYEVLFEFSRGSGFINRGFLYGCYLPIYGFGILILYFTLNKLMKKKLYIAKLNITPVLMFLAILVISSTIEYLSSWILELIFNQRWWDYTYEKYHLNGRIFLKNCILIAVAGMAAIYGLEPLIRKLLSNVKTNLLNYLAIIIATVVTIDFIITLMRYF